MLDGALTISQAYSLFSVRNRAHGGGGPWCGHGAASAVVTSDRHHFVAPDNGVLSLVYQREERMHARHVTGEHYFLQPVSNTFHARDIFAPVAAYLAKGVDPAEVW